MRVQAQTSQRERIFKEDLECDKIVPPTDKFPFWTIYWDEDSVTFLNMYGLHSLDLKEVSKDGTVSLDKVSDLRS